MEEYDYEIEYVNGKNNAVADALSGITLQDSTNIPKETKHIPATTRAITGKIEPVKMSRSNEKEGKLSLKMDETLDGNSMLGIQTIKFEIRPDNLRISGKTKLL